MINQLNRSRPIVEDDGTMVKRFEEWASNVSRLGIFDGTGSPEGVVAAIPTQLYMDVTGTAGNILYIKRDADIGGDETLGWVLV